MIECLSIGVEERSCRLRGIARPWHFTAREVKRGRVSDEIDDRRAEPRSIEVAEAVRIVSDHELFDMSVAVHRDRWQPPAEIAELVTGPVADLPRQHAEVPKRARAHLVEESLGSALGAQCRLVEAQARSFTERGASGPLQPRSRPCLKGSEPGTNQDTYSTGNCRD